MQEPAPDRGLQGHSLPYGYLRRLARLAVQSPYACLEVPARYTRRKSNKVGAVPGQEELVEEGEVQDAAYTP